MKLNTTISEKVWHYVMEILRGSTLAAGSTFPNLLYFLIFITRANIYVYVRAYVYTCAETTLTRLLPDLNTAPDCTTRMKKININRPDCLNYL
jgi:hypothetical protein